MRMVDFKSAASTNSAIRAKNW